MPSGGVIAKEEPTTEKLPSDHKKAPRVEGDGMDAHLETGEKESSKEKSKDDKTEEDSNAKSVSSK